ncbi:hypothetical protein NE865_09405 [Phthorimaea operculella]|nr:hypothetical protein NE865_09405 [Phthorimaea operculella]
MDKILDRLHALENQIASSTLPSSTPLIRPSAEHCPPSFAPRPRETPEINADASSAAPPVAAPPVAAPQNVLLQKDTDRILLTGVEGTSPIIRSLVRDVALSNSQPNREALLVLRRQRASELLESNQQRQDAYVNQGRHPPRTFAAGDFVFVGKSSQSTGKLDSGMRGPYKVLRVLPHHRYELELLAGSYGKKTQAAAEHMVLWRGEWTPDVCEAFFENDDANNDDPGGELQKEMVQASEDAELSGTAVLDESAYEPSPATDVSPIPGPSWR